MEAIGRPQPLWCRRSSKCQQDNCVEVTRYPDAVRIGDTKAEDDAVLEVSPHAWRSFLGGLQGLHRTTG